MRLWLIVMVLLVASPAIADDAGEALIRRGVTFEIRQDYDSALRIYRELADLPGQAGTAFFLQARVAFHRKDYVQSRELSKRAVSHATGSWRELAKLLYGDTLFATGETQRAKLIFIALRHQTAGAAPELVKRIVACNRQLRLPDRDGL